MTNVSNEKIAEWHPIFFSVQFGTWIEEETHKSAIRFDELVERHNALLAEVSRLRAERDVDRLLAVAERAAREMQEQAASLFGQQWARTEVMQLDPAAIARRAAAEQDETK